MSMLTAEQVEKAIRDCSIYASYDGCTYYASGIRLQAIADELNAAMGGGTCERDVYIDKIYTVLEPLIMRESWSALVGKEPKGKSILRALPKICYTTLGSGTCEWILEHSGTLYDKWRCSECGYLHVSSRCDAGATDFDPKFCPNCGRQVKR